MKKVKITYNSPVVLTFALLCVIFFAVNQITHGASNYTFFITRRSSLLSPLTWLRLFTHVLGHASWDHLVGNMMLFLVLGPMLEEKYGSSNILLVVGTTALVTGIVNTIIGTAGLLGASGVIFAFIILASMTSFRRGEIPLTLILVVVLYIGKEIVNGLNATDNISQLAHIGGGLTGGLLGYYIASKNEDAIK